MGTRSDIIVQLANGKWKRIYCHWDGYLDHNGKILHENYNTQAKVDALVAPGDLSSLAEKCSKPAGHSFDKPKKGYCVYYGRDRGETDVAGQTGDSLKAVWPASDTWTEFTYVWSREHGNSDGQWYVSSPEKPDHLISLDAALRGEESPGALVKAFGMVLGQHA